MGLCIPMLCLMASGPLLAAASAPEGVQTQADSALVPEPAAIDFGTVAQLSCAERLVRLRNGTGTIVQVDGIGSDCQCLSSIIPVRTLPPGAEIEWRIGLNVCSEYVGVVRRHVWLTTDQPGAPRIKVAVRYKVVPALYAEPAFVGLGLLGYDVVEQEVEIRTLAKETIQLLAVRCDDGQVVTDLLENVVTAEKPGRVRIHLQGPVPDGPFEHTVVVDTACPSVPQLRIPLYGESIEGLSSTCREVIFDAVPLGRSEKKTLELACQPGVTLGSIRTSNDAVVAESVRRDEKKVSITLRSEAQLPLGEFRGYLILEVNHGQNRNVKLPYRGQVVEPPTAAGPPALATSRPAVPSGGGHP